MTTTLYLTPGDDFVYTATVVDEDGDPYDLSGATLWWTAKARLSDADDDAVAALYWVSGGSASGITVATPATGEAAIRLTPDETDDFTQRAHHWDLQLSDAVGVVRTVDSGLIIVRAGATLRVTTP